MTPRRVTHLLVAHALAEGEPLGPLLRSLGLIATAAEAGRLGDSLRGLGIPADLAQLGERWPAAVRPALGRLARIPPALTLQVPLLQLVGYFVLIAVTQLGALWLSQLHVLPSLAAVGADPAMGDTDVVLRLYLLLDVVLLGSLALLFVGCVAVITRADSPTFPGGGRHTLHAREAALAAALLDSGAPAEVRNDIASSFQVLRGVGPTAGELDLVFDHALERAGAARQRFVSLVRVVGLGILTLTALAATASMYVLVARLGSTVL